jgi:tetratricopeptide (TPR) repeat protein
MLRFAVLLLALAGCAIPLRAEDKDTPAGPAFAIELEPQAAIPLVGDMAALLSASGGARLSAAMGIGSSPIFLGLETSYDLGSVNLAKTLLHTIAVGPEAFVSLELGPRISFRTVLSGGWYYTMLDDAGTMSGGGSFYAAGSVGVRLLLDQVFDLGIGVGYRQLFGIDGALTLSLGASVALGDTSARARQMQSLDARAVPLGPRKPDPDKGLRFLDVQVDSVFPVLRNFYDDHPVGFVKLLNQEKVRVTNLSARLFVKSYMDSPKEIAIPAEIAPGASVTVDLYALFNKSVMSITESEKAPVEITLTYSVRGDDYQDGTIRTMTIWGRNNMTWDDTRKAAAFVTRNDPTVQLLARNAGLALADKTSNILTRRLLSAMAVHRMTILAGLQYRVDPTSSYATLSGRQSMVDSLNFPVETIDKLGGDCDDLSILYAAVLEALGVPTAFVTAPGHIYIAFDLGISAAAAQQAFADARDIYVRNGTAWMPIEVTERARSFVDAWRLGAQEWKSADGTSGFGLYPMAEALELYKPVQADEAAARVVPDKEAIAAALKEDIDAFRQRELLPLLDAQTRKDAKKTDPAIQNRVAVLLGRWGDLDGAEKALAPFTRDQSTAYAPALVNLGLVRMLRGKPQEAISLFSAALERDPTNLAALAGQARAAYALGRAEDARAAWDKLNAAAPTMAARISYIAEQTGSEARGASTTDKGEMEWAD